MRIVIRIGKQYVFNSIDTTSTSGISLVGVFKLRWFDLNNSDLRRFRISNTSNFEIVELRNIRYSIDIEVFDIRKRRIFEVFL